MKTEIDVKVIKDLLPLNCYVKHTLSRLNGVGFREEHAYGVAAWGQRAVWSDGRRRAYLETLDADGLTDSLDPQEIEDGGVHAGVGGD